MTTWDDQVSVIAAAGTGTTKCNALAAGVQTAVRAAYRSRCDQTMTPQAVKAVEEALAEIAGASAALKTALGL